ncbi:MAG: hypothetical protein N3D79_06445 [Acidilobaceae archaeon]|nr:hypothetical protein [Acidilobaceae archaeon]
MRFFPLILMITMIIMANASAYLQMSATVELVPQRPTANFVAPPPCQVSRSSAALVYTDFDEATFPPPGWAVDGGIWVRDAAGHKGQGARNTVSSASGKGHQVYWTTSISSYSSLWAAVKVRGDPSANYKGIAFLDSTRTRVYEISIYFGDLYIWSYTPAGDWQFHAGSSVSGGVSAGQWYTIVVRYTVTGNSITIEAWAYRPDGALGASTSATITGGRFFQPAYVGIHSWGPADPRYDDFVASTGDPRTISFSAPAPVSVEVRDDAGTLEFTGSGTSFSVTVVRDIVLGRGYPGSIRVYNGTRLCGEYSSIVLGSDVFRIYMLASYSACPAGTCASATWRVPTVSVAAVNISATQPFTARLIYSGHSGSLAGYSAQIRLVGAASSTPIVISGGAVNPSETSIVTLNTNSRNYVNLTASGPSTLTLNLLLELCPSATPPRGVCLYYPLTLTLRP